MSKCFMDYKRFSLYIVVAHVLKMAAKNGINAFSSRRAAIPVVTTYCILKTTVVFMIIIVLITASLDIVTKISITS